MPDALLISSAGLGSLCIAGYLAVCVTGATKLAPKLSEAAVLLLSSAGFISGIKVALLAFDPAITGIDNERLYIFLGGIALMWVSIETVIRLYISIWKQTRP